MLKTLKISLLIIIAQLVGCSTIAGLGDDIKKSAEWAKEKLPSTEVNK
jgi:predicted small secreted protein